MNMTHDKINTIVFFGPTNTGKSLLANLIINNMLVGIVQRTGDQSAFHLSNLVNKTCAIMEEPRITAVTVNDMKLLFGGESTLEVGIKHQDSERLDRIPIVVTTNTDLGRWIPTADAVPLKSRTITFNFNNVIEQTRTTDRSRYLEAAVGAPPMNICQCMLYDLKVQYE